MADARVALVGTTVVACSGLTGYFALMNIAPGTVQLRALRIPYAPATEQVLIRDGLVSSVEIRLAAGGISLNGQTQGAGEPPDAAHRIVAALFANITPAPDQAIAARADTIVALALTRQRAADAKSPDYLGTLNDLAEQRNASLAALLPSDSARAVLLANVKRNPEAACRPRTASGER